LSGGEKGVKARRGEVTSGQKGLSPAKVGTLQKRWRGKGKKKEAEKP